MNQESKLIKSKLGLLNLAEPLGNVSQACRVIGYSRDSFYRIKEVEPTVEEAVVKMALNCRIPQGSRLIIISDQPYSFDDFANTTIAGNDGLGYYIELKDSVEKKPNSDTLWLTRGRVKTYWLYKKKPWLTCR